MRAFHDTYYRPDNAVLIVAGKFDPQATLADIESTLGKLPKPDRQLPPEYTVEPAQDGERAVTLRRTGGTPLVAAMYHIPAAGSADFVPFDLATTILADTPSGRLYHALVPTKLASGVFGFTMETWIRAWQCSPLNSTPGKSQDAAMKALTGTQPIADGSIEYLGQSARGKGAWELVNQGLVMVPEGRGTFTRMTITENLLMGAFTRKDKEIDADIGDGEPGDPCRGARELRHEVPGGYRRIEALVGHQLHERHWTQRRDG